MEPATMQKWLIAKLFLLTFSIQAENIESKVIGDAEAGKSKSIVCSACHGADGNSVNAEWPKLAGQHEQYIVSQLQKYKSKEIDNAIMYGQVMNLSEQDMYDLAAYYAGQALQPSVADETLVTVGAKIYRGGNKATDLPACMACHGPRGLGNPLSNYPKLSGQHATYTIQTLQQYANGTRDHSVMSDIAKRMTADEIQAVASYIEGLH